MSLTAQQKLDCLVVLLKLKCSDNEWIKLNKLYDLEVEKKEAEAPRQPLADTNKLRKIADEIQNACGDHHSLSSEYYGILAILEKHFGAREFSQHPVPAPTSFNHEEEAVLQELMSSQGLSRMATLRQAL